MSSPRPSLGFIKLSRKSSQLTLSRQPMHVSILKQDVKGVHKLLKQHAASALECTPEGSSTLHLAAATGNVKIMRALLLLDEIGYDHLNALDRHGLTCLHIAAKHSHSAIVDLLVQERRLDVTRTCDNGATVLHLIALNFRTLDEELLMKILAVRRDLPRP